MCESGGDVFNVFCIQQRNEKRKKKTEKSDLVKIAVKHESESMLDQSVAIESSDGKEGPKNWNVNVHRFTR